MKTIKKIAVAVAIAAVASSASFAVDYSGDIQLQPGWQGATTTAGLPSGLASVASFTGGALGDVKFQSNVYHLGIANWNLFNVNEIFSAGFFEKIGLAIIGGVSNAAFGQTEIPMSVIRESSRAGLEMLVGPALGIRAGNVAKLQVGAGFMMGFSVVDISQRIANQSVSLAVSAGSSDRIAWLAGFGLDIQAKFIPRSVVSPLIGFQYAFKGAGEYFLITTTTNPVFTGTENIKESLAEHTYSLYAGVSFNWGAR